MRMVSASQEPILHAAVLHLSQSLMGPNRLVLSQRFERIPPRPILSQLQSNWIGSANVPEN